MAWLGTFYGRLKLEYSTVFPSSNLTDFSKYFEISGSSISYDALAELFAILVVVGNSTTGIAFTDSDGSTVLAHGFVGDVNAGKLLSGSLIACTWNGASGAITIGYGGGLTNGELLHLA